MCSYPLGLERELSAARTAARSSLKVLVGMSEWMRNRLKYASDARIPPLLLNAKSLSISGRFSDAMKQLADRDFILALDRLNDVASLRDLSQSRRNICSETLKASPGELCLAVQANRELSLGKVSQRTGLLLLSQH